MLVCGGVSSCGADAAFVDVRGGGTPLCTRVAITRFCFGADGEADDDTGWLEERNEPRDDDEGRRVVSRRVADGAGESVIGVFSRCCQRQSAKAPPTPTPAATIQKNVLAFGISNSLQPVAVEKQTMEIEKCGTHALYQTSL